MDIDLLPVSTLALLGASVLLFLFRRRSSNSKAQALPPGPPADPLIGHLRILPASSDDFDTFLHQLGETYGDVAYLNILGRPTIILNSVRAAVELLDKRSANYSDRPSMLVYTLMGWTHSLVLTPYGTRFQTHRRMFQQHFSRTASARYRPAQRRDARILARKLLAAPENFDMLFTSFATAVILGITVGHRIEVNDPEDEYVRLAEEVSAEFVKAGSGGGTPLDVFPFLQYFPSWFPGAHYAGVARANAARTREMHEYPLRAVQRQMANGTARPSFMATQLEALNTRKETRDAAEHDFEPTIEDIQGAAAIAYFAGADTTASSLSIFVLAMVLYPDCQARAQAELDDVLGPNRLPDFSDRESLPYLECLLKETLRWNHPVPSGVPHRALEDDVYRGMFIPKGAVIIANTRGMTWDDSLYADPKTFDPTRYMPRPYGRDEPSPQATWGFGRRICPGRHVADASLWIAIATILSTFTISKAVGKDGKEIMPQVAFHTAVTSRPRPFVCNIQPRSQAAARLIMEADTSDDY